jgi:hypothetical protein
VFYFVENRRPSVQRFCEVFGGTVSGAGFFNDAVTDPVFYIRQSFDFNCVFHFCSPFGENGLQKQVELKMSVEFLD